MNLCVLSFKECWEQDGRWLSYGGFPAQVSAIGTLFDAVTLVVVRTSPRVGGIALPTAARVVALRSPGSTSLQRKLTVLVRLPYYIRVIAREVRRADVVHTPVPGDIPFLSLIVANVLRKPLIARYGSSWERTSETTFMNTLTKAVMRRSAGGRNVMLATGAGLGEPAPNMQWLFATAISQTELDAVRPVLDRSAGEPLRVAYVGRLSPEKGVRYLVEACSLLASSASPPAVHLTLMGDGPQRGELESLVDQLRCRAMVEFAGQLPRETLLTRLQTMDVCVLPSLTESFCKARLDAMLCGVPVLTTPVGFGSEIVGSDGARGWIVPPACASAIADVLQALVTSPPAWHALRRRCRAYVEERTLESWVGRIRAICSAQWNMRVVDGKLRL